MADPKTVWSPMQPETMPVDPRKVLFVGMGASAVAWYRCFLPAMFMNADWEGVAGEPPYLRYLTGLVKGRTQLANWLDYEVIVLQQPRGQGWLKLIRELQKRGVRVLYEVDDYLHAIRKQQDHDFRHAFNKDELKRLELTMRVCDGVICSTPYIARRYQSFNRRTWVCRNGIDIDRYSLTRPDRPTVNVGWAGATGHIKAAIPWLQQMMPVMAARENTCFVSIGQNFGDEFNKQFPDRGISVPWTALETYPAAMTMLDIALAPAGKTNFFRGKSDLRWVEAGALGIAVVADTDLYPEIEHGVTGFHASTPIEARDLVLQLVDDDDLRQRVGAAAREHVRSQRAMRVMVHQWGEVFREVLELPAAA